MRSRSGADWPSLPAIFFLKLIEKGQDSLDVRAVRLVCKRWKLSVDGNLRTLKPSSARVAQVAASFCSVRRLDMSSVVSSTDVAVRTLVWMKRLEYLSLRGSFTSIHSLLAPVNRLSALSRLDLAFTEGLDEGGLSALGTLSLLRKLKLSGDRAPLHGDQMTALRSCAQLQCLQVSRVLGCDESMLEAIASLTGLTSLGIDQCLTTVDKLQNDWFRVDDDLEHPMPPAEVHPSQLHALGMLFDNLRDLRKLKLQGCRRLMGNFEVDFLAKPANLTCLHLGEKFIYVRHEDWVSPLSRLTSLEHLNLAANGKWNGGGVNSLSTLTRLTALSLYVYDGGIMTGGLMALTSLCNLRELQINDASMVPDQPTMHALGCCLSHLQMLKLAASKGAYEAKDISSFTTHGTLQHLEVLIDTSVPAELSAIIRRLPRLVHLDFSFGGVFDGSTLEAMTGLPHLSCLLLTNSSWSATTDFGLLGGLKPLQHLSLTQWDGFEQDRDECDPQGRLQMVWQCIWAIQRLTKLTYLDFSGEYLNDDMLDLLTNLRSLRQLKLDDSRISQQGLARLAVMTGLKHLHVPNQRTWDLLLH